MEVLLFVGVIIVIILLIRNSMDSSPRVRVSVSTEDSPFYRERYANVDPDSVWVSSGKPVNISGEHIPGGMLYVGNYLQPAGGYSSVEPSLINPKLNVNFNNPDIDGSGMSYWPSYADIDPSSRAAYINWLSSGRSDPNYSIGYVFLFFYGLERRVFVDTRNSEQAVSEISEITFEVKRLLDIYGSNWSFNGYANRFLEAVQIMQSPERQYNFPPPIERTSWELPINLRMGIGQLISEGKPISSAWAYSWILLHPDTRLRTPATRCGDDLKALFNIRYIAKYGNGMTLKPNKSRLNISIHPASHGIGQVKIPCGDLPDISRVTGPVNKLRKIIEDCTDLLDPMSRYLGRNPDQEGSLEAFGLLPLELIETKTNPAADSIKNWISDKLGDNQQTAVDASELIALWTDTDVAGLSKKESVALAHLLEKFGHGLEPDPRFGGTNLKAIGKAIIFSLEKNSPKVPTEEYQAATVLLRLAAIISGIDGTVAESERDYLEAHVEKALKLSKGEKQRIKAHLDWLLYDPPGLAGMKKRVESLQASEKSSIAAFCLGVAGADGHIDPSEIKILNKLYPMLGYSEDEVFTHIHSMMSGGNIPDAPVTIQKAGDDQHGFKVPSEVNIEQIQKNGVDLDMSIVRAKLEETATVTQILGDIFDEEEPEEVPILSDQQKENTIGPLDPAHSLLLRELVKQSEWRRSEFEILAERHGLLPDGALDILNDAAYELCDEPLLEGDDPIEVEMDLVKEYFS
ncbi:MAG: TerB N-terminal domain-containing protein [Candidatus Marinimicrobia bacterium]|nr:TerB N-terminal domain-containing protein [Candidatus Neomarinimicrobiota bacterium]